MSSGFEYIVEQLSNNSKLIDAAFSCQSSESIKWKPSDEKWCLLEIACHLLDEEREDFRLRIQYIWQSPEGQPPGIDPEGWVLSRNYMDQDYDQVISKFLEERAASVSWLKSLQNPDWKAYFVHPKYGELHAEMFLHNWLAHDYLHIRQINKLKYQYLEYKSPAIMLRYAGDW